jgi:glyoxylase-like metal-dependent hydrolase (beta-lactamase superfamily II)
MMHSGDAPMMTDGRINGFYDFYGKECTHRPAERLLEDGDTVSLGDEEIKVISTPGHSPGSICLLCHGDGEDFLISGDTLFSNSVGRWDLWQGNSEILARSLAYLKALDGNMRIYAGHGEDSTLASALENAKYYLDF